MSTGADWCVCLCVPSLAERMEGRRHFGFKLWSLQPTDVHSTSAGRLITRGVSPSLCFTLQGAGYEEEGLLCQSFRMASEGSTIPSPVVRQIDKQFLICSICLDRYENPKVLPCLHTFCERWVDFSVRRGLNNNSFALDGAASGDFSVLVPICLTTGFCFWYKGETLDCALVASGVWLVVEYCCFLF